MYSNNKFSFLYMYSSASDTNMYKKELFVMAIQTPCGKTFPGNFSIILSLKKWVFHTTFRLAFLQLWKWDLLHELFSINQWGRAEYRSFEALIVTNDIFKSSKVMLRIFHAIWQPFKWDIYSLLPRIELAEVGSQWCKWFLYRNMIILHKKIDMKRTLVHPFPSYLYIQSFPVPGLCLWNSSPIW